MKRDFESRTWKVGRIAGLVQVQVVARGRVVVTSTFEPSEALNLAEQLSREAQLLRPSPDTFNLADKQSLRAYPIEWPMKASDGPTCDKPKRKARPAHLRLVR